MTLDIRIEQQPPLHALEIARNAPMWKIPKLLGNDFPRIGEQITAQGGNRAGAPYVRYMEIDWQQMRHCGPLRMLWLMLTSKQPMRIGMAVEAPGDGDGDIEANDVELADYTMENYINDPTTVD